MTRNPEDPDIDTKFDELAAEWGRVYVAYYPDWDDDKCIVRNQTDEGLPVGTDLQEVHADTLTAAVAKAHSRYVDESDD